MIPPVLLLQCGNVMPEIAATHGDFDQWFLRAMERDGLDIRVADVFRESPPEPEGFKGVLLTGSLASAWWNQTWILRLSAWIRRVAALKLPILGVCFGHQILARALEGTTRRNPAGREVGTREIRLTPQGREDWLFRGMPETFPAQLTHDDDVEALPPGGVLLAGNDHTPVQAFGLGDQIRGVQFHPEIDDALMKAIVGYKVEAKILDARPSGILAGIRPTPEAARILSNFAERVKRGVK